MRKKARSAAAAAAKADNDDEGGGDDDDHDDDDDVVMHACSTPGGDDLLPDPTPSSSSAAQNTSTTTRDRGKTSCTVSARMRQVVEQLLMCDHDQYAAALQQTTVFVFKSQQSELIACFLDEMRRENTALYQDREGLMRVIADAYDAMSRLPMPPPTAPPARAAPA